MYWTPYCNTAIIITITTAITVTNLVNKTTLTITTFLMKVEEHNIVVYVNATPYCTTIELEHHRGPCR